MKNRLSSAQHSQKIRQRMNSEKYGLAKLPFIQNNHLYSKRPVHKTRPFSCLPKPKASKKAQDQDMLNRIPSVMVQKKMDFRQKKLGIENIFTQNTKIRETLHLEKKKIELDMDTPIEYVLYDKKDPVLRDIMNGIKRVKTSKKKARSAFRIKTRKQGSRYIERQHETKEDQKNTPNQKRRKTCFVGKKKEPKNKFFLHRRTAEEKNHKTKEKLKLFKHELNKEITFVDDPKLESEVLKKEEMFNKDEMTKCALKYLPPEMRLFDDEVLYKEETRSYTDIFSECNDHLYFKNQPQYKEKDSQSKYTNLVEEEENNFLKSEDIKQEAPDAKKPTKLEQEFTLLVTKKLKSIRNANEFGSQSKSQARQNLAIQKMKQRQKEEEEFRSPTERIGRYMQFSSVLQKEHLLDVLDFIEGVSKKEKKDGEIPIQLVRWNERIGLNRIQRVGASYYEDIDSLLKRNCFMVYPEFLDPQLKAFLMEHEIVSKVDFRDRLRPTEEYYTWLLSQSGDTYDPIFLANLAIDPPNLNELPEPIRELIGDSTFRYEALTRNNELIPSTVLSPYRRYWIEHTLSKVDYFFVEEYKKEFTRLWTEIFDEYIITGRQIIIDYALRYHRERRRWGIVLLKRPRLSFAQKIFEAGGYHRQFHERWHRMFENAKRFMTRDFFGVNGLSLGLHQWFQNFQNLSLCELTLTRSLGHLDCALSLKEFFLFQNFYRKKVLGLLNQILIRGAYFLIKKRKLFCKEEFAKFAWFAGGCSQTKSLDDSPLTLGKMAALFPRPSEKNGLSNIHRVIKLLEIMEQDRNNGVAHVDFHDLMLGTKLRHLGQIAFEHPLVDLERTKFNFCQKGEDWDSHFYIREDFKVQILKGVKPVQSKEEVLAQEKLEKSLSSLMGLRLRDILSKSIEQVLEFFESFSVDSLEETAGLFANHSSTKLLKRIRNETFSPIFKVELVVDNGVLKLGEIQKQLIQELNTFFLSLCQSFNDVRKPKYVNVKFVKNAFKKTSTLSTEEKNMESEEPGEETLLDCKNLAELNKKKEINMVKDVSKRLKEFTIETDFEKLYSHYLSEVQVEHTTIIANDEDASKVNLPFVGNLFQTYRDRIEQVIQLVVSHLQQSKSVLQRYYEFHDVFSGKFKEEVLALKSSNDLKKLIEFYKRIRRLDATLDSIPSRCFFRMFEVSMAKVNNTVRIKLNEEKSILEGRIESILTLQGNELMLKYKTIESRLRGATETYTEVFGLETYLGKLDKELLSLVQRSQLFFKKIVLIIKEKIFCERRVALMNICKELKDFPHRIKKEKSIAQNRLRESRKKLIAELSYRTNTFQLEVQSVIAEFSEVENRTLVFEDCQTWSKQIRTSQEKYLKINSEFDRISEQFEVLHKKRFEESLLFQFRLKAEPYYCLWRVCFQFMDFRKEMLQTDIKQLLGVDLDGKRLQIQDNLEEFQETFLKSFSLLESNLDKPSLKNSRFSKASQEQQCNSQKNSLLVLKESNVNSLMRLKTSLEDQIQKFEEYLPLLNILIRTDLEPRHWQAIQGRIGKEFLTEDLNIKNIQTYIEEGDIRVVKEVAKKARKEKKIDQILSNSVAKFKQLRLDVDESNVKKRFDLGQLGELERVLEEEAIKLDRVINLRREKYQKGSLVDIRRLLKKSLELVKTIKETQVLLDELKIVFEGEEMRSALGRTWKKFEVEEREFRESLRAVEMGGSLESVITSEGNPILLLFLKLNHELKSIKDEVWQHLQSKRMSFPRFFCLNDQELFSLLKDYGMENGLATVEKCLPKMFKDVNVFVKNHQKKNIICGVGHRPRSNCFEQEEKEFTKNACIRNTLNLQIREELKFQEEIEVQRFILEEFMKKIENSISEEIVRGVKGRLNVYMQSLALVNENQSEDLLAWIKDSTTQEIFICFSIIISKKLDSFKGHSKEFNNFEKYLNSKIEFLVAVYARRKSGEKPVIPKLLHLLCFLSRVRELFNQKLKNDSFFRELSMYFQIEKNGVPEKNFIEDEDSEKKSFEDFPQWSLKVKNSFFCLDFGGEFIANLDPVNLVPSNEKSLISMFSCLHKHKVGLFNQSAGFKETLASLSNFTGHFLRFVELGPHFCSTTMITSLLQSSLYGGFWCGVDFSLIEDYEFLSEVTVQLLIITYLQYYHSVSGEEPSAPDTTLPHPTLQIGGDASPFEPQLVKKDIEEFLGQFKILPVATSINNLENKTKAKYFVNCSPQNLNFFKLGLKSTWRNVTCFKPPTPAFFETLLYLQGVGHVPQIVSILRQFFEKCEILQVPLMVKLENKSVISSLVCLIKRDIQKKGDFRAISRTLMNILKSFFSRFVSKSHHYHITSILDKLFSKYLPRKKYSLRPRLSSNTNMFTDQIRNFRDSLSTLLDFSASILVTGHFFDFLPALIVKVLDKRKSLVFNFSPLNAENQELFGSSVRKGQANLKSIFMDSENSNYLKTVRSKSGTKNQTLQVSQARQHQSFYSNKVNFKSKLKNGSSSPGFYSLLFQFFEHFSSSGECLLKCLKQFDLFCLDESLNQRLSKSVVQLERLLFKPDFKLSIPNSKLSQFKLKKDSSASQSSTTPESGGQYSSVTFLVDAPPSDAYTLLNSSNEGTYIHEDGSVSFFERNSLRCIFRCPDLSNIPPDILGKTSLVHLDAQDSFVFFESAFKFEVDLLFRDLPNKMSLEEPVCPSLNVFSSALVKLFSLLFERILMIQKKSASIPKTSAFKNFVCLVKSSLPGFLHANPELLSGPSPQVTARCVLGFFLQSVNFSVNLSPDQKTRKVFNKYLKSLLDSHFNYNTAAKYPLPLDHSLLKGMTTFDLDFFHFRNTQWHSLANFLDPQSPNEPHKQVSVSRSINNSNQMTNLLLSKKSTFNISSSKLSMNINESVFLNLDQENSHFVSQSNTSLNPPRHFPLPSQLFFLHSYLQHSKSATLKYHPRFPLPQFVTKLLNMPLSPEKTTPHTPRSILKISPFEQVSKSFLQNTLLQQYVPVDPTTLKHSKASNLTDISMTIFIQDVNLRHPFHLSFWNRLSATGEIQNLSSPPFSICLAHNTQLLCLSPYETGEASITEHSVQLENSPRITIPNFHSRQLQTIFTQIIDPNVAMDAKGLIDQVKTSSVDPFVLEFSEKISPFLTELYFSSNLKDNFHLSVSDPRIFNILFELCLKINEARAKPGGFSPGVVVSTFQTVFRQSNITQESAATILYNSSVHLFKSCSSHSSKNLLASSQIAQAINDLCKDPVHKHFFRQIAFGNYSAEIIEQVCRLSGDTWVFAGSHKLMKLQHLLISGLIHSFRVINPESPVVRCEQLKLSLAGVFEEHIKFRNPEKVVILVDLRNRGEELETQKLTHLILNKQFNLAFSKREVRDWGKRISKQRQTMFRRLKTKSVSEVSLVDVFNNFFDSMVSFCISEFDAGFEQKRRVFLTFPRVDMKSFSEFIETNFIKNQIFACTEFFDFLRDVNLPLTNTTAFDFFNRFLENFNFFWKNKYGESDLNVLQTLIHNTSFSLMKIREERQQIERYWKKINEADSHSEELLKNGHDQIKKLQEIVDKKEEELSAKQAIFSVKESEMKEATELHVQIQQKYKMELEELDLLRETEHNIFGALRKNYEVQLGKLEKIKLKQTTGLLKKNKGNATVNALAKALCVLFFSKSTSKVLTGGKMVNSWVDVFCAKMTSDFEGKFMSLVQSGFSKKVVNLFRNFVVNDKTIHKKLSSQMNLLRVIRSIILTKVSIEVKLQENREFTASLEKQSQICGTYSKEVEVCSRRVDRVQSDYETLTLQINIIREELGRQNENIRLLKFKLENSKRYIKKGATKETWDPRLVKPEMIFLDALTAGLYFTIGYQISTDPMLLNGLKNMISFNCDQFLLEEAFAVSHRRPLVKVFCKQNNIEKLFWGNYIFGIETLSKFERIKQCKLKIFVVRDPFAMCFNLVREVNFKKDIVIVRSLTELCVGDLHNSITEGKLLLLMNIRLSELKMTKDKLTDLCDCTRCRNITQFKSDLTSNQNSVNHLLSLLRNPREYADQVYKKATKDSLQFLKEAEQYEKKKKFKLIIFTKDQFEEFQQNEALSQNCLFEEFLENTSDLEGKLGLLFMELLNQKMHQNYLLNCREIIKKIKSQNHLKKEMAQILAELDSSLIEDRGVLGQFISLRGELEDCCRELHLLKKKNKLIIQEMRTSHVGFTSKITSLWKITMLICKQKNLRRLTVVEVLLFIRKLIGDEGRVNMQKITGFFFDCVKFGLRVEERELLGVFLIFLTENKNPKVSIERVMDLVLVKGKKTSGHPLFHLNDEIQINKDTLFNGLFNCQKQHHANEQKNSLIFDHLILKFIDSSEATKESNKTTPSSFSFEEDPQDSETKNEMRERSLVLELKKVNLTRFSKTQIAGLADLQKKIKGFKNLINEIAKIENEFYERFFNENKPIWSFSFLVDNHKLGPLELLLILKVVNLEKFIFDVGIFVKWYFSFFIHLPLSSQKEVSNMEKLHVPGPDKEEPQIAFQEFSREALLSLKKFVNHNYNENTKEFLILKDLKEHLIYNIKQGKLANYKHFVEAMPAESLVFFKSLARMRNVKYSYLYIYSNRQIEQLLAKLQETQEKNEWLFIEMSFFNLEVFGRLDHFIHLIEQSQNSLLNFQIFIFTPPNLKVFDLIPAKFQESFKIYRLNMEFPLFYTSFKFLFCFEKFLQFPSQLQHFYYEQFNRVLMHSNIVEDFKRGMEEKMKKMTNLEKEKNQFLVKVLLSMGYSLTAKTLPQGSLSQKIYYQEIMNFISDAVVTIWAANRHVSAILQYGEEFRTKQQMRYKLNQLKKILKSLLITKYSSVSASLDKINDSLISEYDSLKFSNELSVGIKNVIEEAISDSSDFLQTVRNVKLAVFQLVRSSSRGELRNFLNVGGISQVKNHAVASFHFDTFSRFLRSHFHLEKRLRHLKYDFYVKRFLQEPDSKFQIDYRSVRNSELFTSTCFEGLASLAGIPDLVLNLWRFSYLSLAQFRCKIMKVILQNLLERVPKKINIHLIEIKYKILKKDPLDELFISEYYLFNKNIKNLSSLLHQALLKVYSGVADSELAALMKNRIPKTWRKGRISCTSFIRDLDQLLKYLQAQREYFIMVIEKNYKFLFDLKFFRDPKKMLQVAKQVVSKRIHAAEKSLTEEYKIYDTDEVDASVKIDLEVGAKNIYFIKGLNLVGCKLHYIDQKLMESPIHSRSVFSRAPILMVRLLQREEAAPSFLHKQHSLPVYRCFPRSLYLRRPPIGASPEHSLICLPCLQFFCNNVQYFDIKDENFMKLIYELRGRLSSNLYLNFYRLQDIPPAFSKILSNINQICVHRHKADEGPGRGLRINSVDDFNDYFLLSLRFPTIEKESHWIKKIAYAVLTVPEYYECGD